MIKVLKDRVLINGQTVKFDFGSGDRPVVLADVVPLVRRISDAVAAAAVKEASTKSKVPCQKGCAACCKRHLVPLSVPEAFRLTWEILNDPRIETKSVMRTMLTASKKILESRPPIVLPARITGRDEPDEDALACISNWYSTLDIECPFLDNNICSIYDTRPLACREHYILGSFHACSGENSSAALLDLPLRMVDVLGRLGAELENRETEAVILPLAPAFCDANAERTAKAWPARVITSKLARIIADSVADRYPRSIPIMPISVAKARKPFSRLAV